MMTPAQMKKWIDEAPYEMLLKHWRFAKAGDPFFQGEVGDYYKKVMLEKKDLVGQTGHIQASKRLGWDNRQ